MKERIMKNKAVFELIIFDLLFCIFIVLTKANREPFEIVTLSGSMFILNVVTFIDIKLRKEKAEGNKKEKLMKVLYYFALALAAVGFGHIIL